MGSSAPAYYVTTNLADRATLKKQIWVFTKEGSQEKRSKKEFLSCGMAWVSPAQMLLSQSLVMLTPSPIAWQESRGGAFFLVPPPIPLQLFYTSGKAFPPPLPTTPG